MRTTTPQWFEMTRIAIPLEEGRWAAGFVLEDRVRGRPATSVVQLFDAVFPDVETVASKSLSRLARRTLSILMVAGDPSRDAGWRVLCNERPETVGTQRLRDPYSALFEGRCDEKVYTAAEVESLLSRHHDSSFWADLAEASAREAGVALVKPVTVEPPPDWCAYE